jgi:hypothetical protein
LPDKKVSKCEGDEFEIQASNSRDYRLFKIHRVAMQAGVEGFALCVIVTVILSMLQLIVGKTGDYPINQFTNPNPVYESLIHMTILIWSSGREVMLSKLN